MKKIALVLALAACGISGVAQAVVIPQSAGGDYRIKQVAYDPSEVYRIDAVIAIQTHIILSPDEHYVTHAFGDPKAWVFGHAENHYFIKPKAPNGDTNLAIVTNKRTYNFIIHYIGDYKSREDGKVVTKDIEQPWSLRQATLQIQFLYPREAAQANADALRKADIENRFAGRGGKNNLNYSMSATPLDMAIVPVNTWDNGRFTYFKFAPGTELPNVYEVTSDGEEKLVNRSMSGEGGYVIGVDKVRARWRLRLGNEVVGIYNDSFGPGSVTPNTTGTSTPAVTRVIKGGN
ncbi:type IV secretion system protein VirB9 [Burkholderia latens]|uniref:TrbG/VirB9 family P-type conjugative transfer protein n=1 Tax=Burkholderia latens TaxID=488446 RepID=UPI0039A6E8C9